MPDPPVFEQSDKAWYSPSKDAVGIPARGLFHSSEEYYCTLFHELAHSTGHTKRLHRDDFDNPVSFGSESYSKEELIAEMTAAMLCGIAGVEQKTLENSVAYLKTWIARLKSDSRLQAVIDPGATAGVALLAGGEQARGTPDYGGGMKGYGEGFGANYANQFTSIMIGGAVLPSLLHQDPRYLYQGTGTKVSRALHAISFVFVTKWDNGRWQPIYSSLGGDLASAAISNTYSPALNRGTSLMMQNFAINTGVHFAVRLLQEFLFRPKK